MATNVCTILLDAYSPEHHLVAADGRLMSQAEFQNLSTIRRRVYALPLHEGWGALLSARGRIGYAVTLYGDAFERRYFEGIIRFHRAAKDGTFGELTVRPLPESVDLPLERRFAELDAAAGQAPYLQRTVYVVLFGRYATREWRERLEQETDAAMDEGWRAATRHGLGVEFVLAQDAAALVALSEGTPLSAAIAAPQDLPTVVGARGLSMADGTRGALLVPGVTQGEPEMVNDAIGSDWFLWGLPGEADVPGALAAFLRHACAKAHFRTLLERAGLPAKTVGEQALLARLGTCRPMLLLDPPGTVEREDVCERPLRWSVPWEQAFPEIDAGAAPVFSVHPGEDSIEVEVDGDEVAFHGRSIYGTAEVACVWNGGLDRRRFEIDCVPSSGASSESRIRVTKKWLDERWAAEVMDEDRLIGVLMFEGSSVCLEPVWINAHGERLPTENMRWEITPFTPSVHKALPKAALADGRLTIEVPEADAYFVTLTYGDFSLLVKILAHPQPSGIALFLDSSDGQTRVSGAGDRWRVRLCQASTLFIRAYYLYPDAAYVRVAEIQKNCEAFDLRRFPALLPRAFDEATGETLERDGEEQFLTAPGKGSAMRFVKLKVVDVIGEALRLSTHKPCPPAEIRVRIAKDRTLPLAVFSVMATALCLLCFYLANYGLNTVRSTLYLIAAVPQLFLALTPVFVNRARLLQALGVVSILCFFLYELYQEMS